MFDQNNLTFCPLTIKVRTDPMVGASPISHVRAKQMSKNCRPSKMFYQILNYQILPSTTPTLVLTGLGWYDPVQFQKLRSSELDRFCLNGLSQLGDEERILTTISLKSILFNKYEVWNTNYSNMYKTKKIIYLNF